MTVTLAQRRAHRPYWRSLVLGANAALDAPTGDLRDLRKTGLTAMKSWLTPTDDLAETALCGAFAHLVYAYARQPSAGPRMPMAPAVKVLAEMVAALLDRSEGQRPPPPSLPFRADLDG